MKTTREASSYVGGTASPKVLHSENTDELYQVLREHCPNAEISASARPPELPAARLASVEHRRGPRRP